MRVFAPSFAGSSSSPLLAGSSLVDREETDQTLVQLGLTRVNCKEEILALSVLDYVDGPLPDINRTGHVWIFGKAIHGVEVYIKLKLVDTEEGDKPICISFHAAERSMEHPFSE